MFPLSHLLSTGLSPHPPPRWQMAGPWSTVCRWTLSMSWSRHVCVQMKNPYRTCTTACVSFLGFDLSPQTQDVLCKSNIWLYSHSDTDTAAGWEYMSEGIDYWVVKQTCRIPMEHSSTSASLTVSVSLILNNTTTFCYWQWKTALFCFLFFYILLSRRIMWLELWNILI